ncbi:5-amino-6-(5-phosphoribosylamino)uracil reductase [Nesterenkonia alkaliphila]|uniref:5-amino-6-(5-phosphoribosylamino)uracil reductase n=2 Tax=Nesterenkonia alkaliphila TaxID=1463631 RepID=A0A7K1UGD8_9MICC|nr:5-amino-6-(5-phosphoribosylamino)uracil reductase [Nesterenkonia alkaliphila]GFZ81028.1 5-amino-6-(5-phosphoribosylamino)uracil reductase [Nesterenkonia alkaliphila]
MHMSLDGKIVGDYLATSVGMASQREFHALAYGPQRHYRSHKGWLSGRITTEDNFTHYRTPDLNKAAAAVPDGDYIAVPDAPMNYFSIDPAGQLGWQKNSIDYFDTNAHVVEVLSGKASNAYKDLLRRLGISYLIAGDDTLDLAQAVEKIGANFGGEELMLGGGGGLNWSFIRAGLCDEVSIVLTPAADGTKGAQTLFEADDRYTTPLPTAFDLQDIQKLDDGSLWLRYTVTGPIN